MEFLRQTQAYAQDVEVAQVKIIVHVLKDTAAHNVNYQPVLELLQMILQFVPVREHVLHLTLVSATLDTLEQVVRLC